MYKLKHLALTGLLCLSACGTPAQHHGLLTFNVAWPQQSSHFEIKVIPEATRALVLQVFDASGKELLTQSLSRQEGTQKISLSLPVGPKRLVATAQDANGNILAISRSEVDIKAGQVSQVLSELIPIEISPSPTDTSTSPNTTPSSQPSPQVSPSAQSSNTDPSPTPETSTSPTPQATASSGSSGGGSGGGGSNTSSPSPSSSPSGGLMLSANPQSLSGMGYASFLTASLPNNESIESVTWSCTPPSGGDSCGSFSENSPQTIWKSPNDNSSFGDNTVKSVLFVITAQGSQANGANFIQSFSITVNRGTGNVAIPSGPPNAGQFDSEN